MKTRRFLKTISQALLYSILILAALCVPLFILTLILDVDTNAASGTDRTVVVGANALESEYNRFAPRKVFRVGVQIEDISEIDVTARSFYGRFVYWGANQFDRSSNDRSLIDTEELRIVNTSGLETELRAVRPVDDGTAAEPEAMDAITEIAYLSHSADGTLRNEYRLRRFPFDVQSLKITIEPRTLTAEDILLDVDPASAMSGAIDLGEWRIVDFTGDATIRVANSDFSDPALINRGALYNYVPRVEFTVTVQRQIYSHLLKDLLPLLVIILMVYTSLFAAPTWFDSRCAVAITGLLSVVALHWSARSDLPGVAYITSMDEFFLVSYMLMLFAIVESVVSINLSPAEGAELPEDYVPHSWLRVGLPVLRVLYPLILIGGWAVVVLRALS